MDQNQLWKRVLAWCAVAGSAMFITGIDELSVALFWRPEIVERPQWFVFDVLAFDVLLVLGVSCHALFFLIVNFKIDCAKYVGTIFSVSMVCGILFSILGWAVDGRSAQQGARSEFAVIRDAQAGFAIGFFIGILIGSYGYPAFLAITRKPPEAT